MTQTTTMRTAEQFMATIREEKTRTGQSMVGRKSLGASLVARITKETSKKSSTQQFNIHNLNFAWHETVEGFVELARRLNRPVPASLLPDVSRCLLAELSQNCLAFQESRKPTELKALTINHGTSFISALTAPEYTLLHDSLHIFRRAAITHPSEPRGFLNGIIANIDDLSTDPAFESLRSTPEIFRIAATKKKDDQRRTLNDHMLGKVNLLENNTNQTLEP